MSRIDILLATYNGSAYLREQLESLEKQSHSDWSLLVRDDGSSDDTLDIVRSWAEQSDHKVRIIEDGRTGLGASLNFANLLEASDAPYFACCDQDDVWLPHKLAVMLAAVQKAENADGAGKPMLAYSDLRVVDGELGPIAASFRQFSRRPQLYAGRELQQVMLHNVVTGCASLGNAALRDAAMPVPPEAAMHDWWLAMVAAGVGRLVDVPEATILYRQHGGNTLGANANDPLSLMRWLLKDTSSALERTRKLMRLTQAQAAAFGARFGEQLEPAVAGLLAEYSQLPEASAIARKAFFLRNRMLADNLMKNMPFFVLS